MHALNLLLTSAHGQTRLPADPFGVASLIGEFVSCA
jgi:hypothetical protein